ncbi:unnamed protein product [Ectocarpus sp. 12 AP-2014]
MLLRSCQRTCPRYLTAAGVCIITLLWLVHVRYWATLLCHVTVFAKPRAQPRRLRWGGTFSLEPWAGTVRRACTKDVSYRSRPNRDRELGVSCSLFRVVVS